MGVIVTWRDNKFIFDKVRIYTLTINAFIQGESVMMKHASVFYLLLFGLFFDAPYAGILMQTKYIHFSDESGEIRFHFRDAR